MRTLGRSRWRAVGSGLVGGALVLGVSGCGQIGSFDPVTSQGLAVSDLFNLELVLSLLLLLLVGGILAAVLVRFRWRAGEAEPPQVAGNRKLEVAWTILPALLLAAMFVLAVRTMNTVNAASPSELRVVVIGHQWWWEFQYPDLGVVTANELHVPAGAPLQLELQSADVIHSFWLPRFGWMKDAIPGRTNQMFVRVDQAGDYLGACTQYCGTEHAWMRIHVVAQPRDQFDVWAQQQRQPATAAGSAAAMHGQQVFQQNTCTNCHTIQGTPAGGRVGPDLTHLSSRATIGAGVLANTRDDLRRWVHDVQDVKPGVLMPNFRDFSDTDLNDLTEYLAGLT